MGDDKKQPDRFNDSAIAAFGVYGAAGVQLAASVVAGAFAGDFLDGKLGTSPWLTVAGIALGFTGGLMNLLKILGWFQRRKG